MKMLVTGAGGFLGRNLVGLLSEACHEVLAVSSQPEQTLRSGWVRDVLGHVDELTTVVPTDELFTRDGVFEGVDVVINAGFPRALGGHDLARGLDFQAALFAAARDSGVGRVLNISSQSVYDSARSTAATEDDPIVLDTPYATAKYAVELLADAILSPIPTVHLRLSSLIGPGFDQRVVNKMVAAAIGGGELRVSGGDQVFDFMDVRDAARAVALMAEAPLLTRTEVLNVGANAAVTLLEIAETVARVLGQAFDLKVVVNVEAGSTAPRSSALQCDRLLDAYGFAPKCSREDTIRAIAFSTPSSIANPSSECAASNPRP